MSDVAKMSVMWFGAGMLPRLRSMTFEQLQVVADEASERSLEFPLHMAGPSKQFEVPSWSAEKLSGCQCIALMVFSLWVMCGEKPEMCSGLYEAWPIKEACMIASPRCS